MKIVVALAFFGVLAALASAGVFMLRGGRARGTGARKNMARALALRVGLSVALFVFILVSYELGWIHPTGIPMR